MFANKDQTQKNGFNVLLILLRSFLLRTVVISIQCSSKMNMKIDFNNRLIYSKLFGITSRKVYTSILCWDYFHRLLQTKSVILLLNKQDLLVDKIKNGVRFENYFPDFARYVISTVESGNIYPSFGEFFLQK
jgi:hypothetical protein